MMMETGENLPNAANSDYASTRPGVSAPAPLSAPAMVSAPVVHRGSARAASPEPFGHLVKRVDGDRWLASRFAPPPARARLEILYAFAYEVARTVEIVREPTLGQMRLTWWRDAIASTGAPASAVGPLAAAMRATIEDAQLDGDLLDRLIATRALDFEAAAFESWGDLDAYVDATAGAIAKVGLQICLPQEARSGQAMACAQLVGRAWGYTGLMRAAPIWHGRGRTFLPKRLLEHFKVPPEAVFADGGGHQAQQIRRAVLERAGHAYAAAKDMAQVLSPASFPAIGYLALEPGYRKRLLAGEAEAVRSLFSRQAQLVASSALGRL
jgi:phytoene synthase